MVALGESIFVVGGKNDEDPYKGPLIVYSFDSHNPTRTVFPSSPSLIRQTILTVLG